MRVVIMTVALVALAATVHAGSYPGYGDTGYNYNSKRVCCDAAVELAREHSMAACQRAGGWPRPKPGVSRGMCNWDRRQDGSGRVWYSCKANTSVRCD